MSSFLLLFPLLKVQEEVTHAYIQEMFAYVVFYGFMTYIQVFNPFRVYFCVWG